VTVAKPVNQIEVTQGEEGPIVLTMEVAAEDDPYRFSLSRWQAYCLLLALFSAFDPRPWRARTAEIRKRSDSNPEEGNRGETG
jgi:hypothetical protein